MFPVGEAIRTLRKAKKWTARDLAHRAGLSDMTISKIERGTANYRRETLDAIAAALGTTVLHLTQGETAAPVPVDDSLTANLLSLWAGILPEHRLAALEAIQHVAAWSSEFRRLRAEVRALEAAGPPPRGEAGSTTGTAKHKPSRRRRVSYTRESP